MSALDLYTFDGDDLPKSGGYLYVVEILDVGVKVGSTKQPTIRIRTHQRDARAYKREIGRVWVSALHEEYKQGEIDLLRAMSRDLPPAGQGQRREYFDETFENAVAVACSVACWRACTCVMTDEQASA